MSEVAKVRFTGYESSVFRALDLIGAAGNLPRDGLIIIKPNLICAKLPPITTNVAAAEAVYKYCSLHSGAEVVIGEGSGYGVTQKSYQFCGYSDLARQYGVRLLDFNQERTILLSNENALQLRQFHMPEILQDAFVISLPTLKDHSYTVTTIAMKNMFGIAPEPFYCGSWNKSKLHTPSTHKSIVDICSYKKPNLCVVDAAVALKGMHLAGEVRKTELILASFDPVAVDAVGSEILGHDPEKIEYLKLSNGLLGDMDNIEILED